MFVRSSDYFIGLLPNIFFVVNMINNLRYFTFLDDNELSYKSFWLSAQTVLNIANDKFYKLYRIYKLRISKDDLEVDFKVYLSS